MELLVGTHCGSDLTGCRHWCPLDTSENREEVGPFDERDAIERKATDF